MSILAIDTWLPPVSLAAVLLFVLLLGRGQWGRALAIGLAAALVLLATPLFSDMLLASLDLPPDLSGGAVPGAIVILGGDVERSVEGADVGALTLERERAGAILAKRTGLPVLVTGGLVTAPPPVAAMMEASLLADFGVPVRWVESRSSTTWENAAFSAPMLRADGIGRVYLVTQAWHMRRAALAFERAGLAVVPAPVRRDPPPRWSPDELVPRTSAWMRSYFALHEWAGFVQYRWLR